ncbi:MAG: ATP-binding protein [Gudongella sp.]|nr:ATP-binding protein [Gudongella sp.]
MDFIYKGTVCSDLEIIKSFVEKNVSTLKDLISNTDILFDVRVILSELILNGALHGNECVASKCISLTLKMDDKKLIIEVEDEGRGIEYNFKDYDSNDLKSFGRGLVIVKGLSDEFYFKNNKVVAVKNIV